jgi:oxygen-independent coproporphyrinogen-3 oxidase
MDHLLPETYCRAVESGNDTASNRETIDARTSEAETMMLGLRLLESGVNRLAFHQRHGRTMEQAFDNTVGGLVDVGLLDDSGDQVRLTHQGLMLANDVATKFLP